MLTDPEDAREPIEPDAIREQVERIISHPLFCNSKRYPTLLRRVTDLTLEGRKEDLNERLLGVEAFGRDQNYDTDADPVVRVTASEIRRRLAQYYMEPEHVGQIRIELPKGSYAAVFRMPPKGALLSPTSGRTSLSRLTYLALGLVVVLTVFAIWRPWIQKSALDRFWEPVVGSPDDVLMCVGQATPANLRIAGISPTPFTWADRVNPAGFPLQMSWQDHLEQTVTIPAANAAFTVAVHLASNGKPPVFKGSSTTTLTDFKTGPVIVIGDFWDDWVFRMLQEARYHFDGEGTLRVIRDRLNAAQSGWSVETGDGGLPEKDYAIVARISEPTTGRVVVIASGFAGWGTNAAAEFLSDPQYFEQLVQDAPKRWQEGNIEIVLETVVVNRKQGIPRVLATHYW